MLILIVELILHASPTSLINTMSEKVSLKWIDYQSNFNRSLAEFRNQTDHSDVTLITDDMVKFSAHKIILSSCSNMFKFIFKDSAHANPLLYLGGVSSVNLGFVLDYMYHGEVSLFQEQLDSFLESAQKLEVEGLLNDNKDNEKISKPDESIPDLNIEDIQYQPEEKNQLEKIDQAPIRRKPSRPSQNDVTKFDVGSMTPEEIKRKTLELFETKDGDFNCLACDFTSSGKSGKWLMKRHIEVHFDGLSYPCTLCNKEFRSKNSLVYHKSTNH